MRWLRDTEQKPALCPGGICLPGGLLGEAGAGSQTWPRGLCGKLEGFAASAVAAKGCEELTCTELL